MTIHPKMIEAIVDGVIPAVKEYTDKTLAPVVAKLAEIEARAPQKGEPGAPGERGQDGLNGKDADEAVIAKLIESAVAALPKPEDGKSITLDDVRPIVEEVVAKIPSAKDGKDADPLEVAALIKLEVETAVAAIPPATDGKSVTIDDVRPVLEELVAKIPPAKDGKDIDAQEVSALVTVEVAKSVAALPPAKDGKDSDPEMTAQMVAQEVAKIPVPKDGEPGHDGKDGRDGLKAEECLVPDDLAVEVGKAIALLAESPPLVPKASQPLVVNVMAPAPKPTNLKMKREKDGSVNVTSQPDEI